MHQTVEECDQSMLCCNEVSQVEQDEAIYITALILLL